MRIDLFLKLMGFAKTRMAAKRLCDAGRVLLQGGPAKPSLELIGGESLHLLFSHKEIRVKVKGLPALKSVPKKDRPLYVYVSDLPIETDKTTGF
ncbi:MAG TPA: S4 domain-containing protein [bacterium]|nr:S4 domain-containing protein [bacterium]